ncbi:MAG: HD domain-containing phosphohydrolase [Oceanospirillaceae bacterium]
MTDQDYSQNSVLLVDDEKPILNALKRLLMPLKCKIHCAASGNEALEILANETVDIVISDMRMPQMSGDELLAQVAQKWPNTERVVLSGYADVDATISAINQGNISRFLLKPWSDQEVITTVTKSFSLRQLMLKNQQLEKLTQQKNQQLAELNHSLEQKVVQRTQQLQSTNSELQESYRAIVKMFSSLIDSRLKTLNNSTPLSFNQLLLDLAAKFDITGNELKQLHFAWQLRHIGKLSFSDELLATPYLLLSVQQQRTFHLHPLHALAVCLRVKPLYPSGKIISQHREYLDGSGYPKGLKAPDIDLRAQIMCALNDYIELTSGLYKQQADSSEQAFSYMQNDVASRYNAEIVSALQELMPKMAKAQTLVYDTRITSDKLKTSMTLSRDIINSAHCLLLSAGQKLDETLIQRIHEMELNLQEKFDIFVNS